MGCGRTSTAHCYMRCFLASAAEKGDFVRPVRKHGYMRCFLASAVVRPWVGGALSENSAICDFLLLDAEKGDFLECF